MKRIAPFLFLVAVSTVSAAQDPAFHARLRDNLDVPGSVYSDVWGDGTVGYIGRFFQSQFDIINAADPDNLSLYSTFSVPAPNNTASTQDHQVGTVPLNRSKKLLFVALDSNGNDGVAIFDVTTPTAPVQLTRIDANPGTYEDIHDVSYRSDGWLAICDSRDPTLAIIDLRSYNPNSPPATITSWTYEITNLGTGFVHDMTLTDDRLYISAWDNFYVYDASNLGGSAPTFLGAVRGSACHSVWPTDDGLFAVTCDERSGGASRLYEVVDNGSSVTLYQRDSFVSPLTGVGLATSPHNPLFFGERAYVSTYEAGVVVLQIDRTTKTFEKVASYDTSTVGTTGGFNGCWGVYPRLGHDRVQASDLDNGFFALDFSAIQISFPSPRPKTVQPFVTTPITIQIDALGTDVLDAASVQVFTRVNGGAFVASPATNLGGGLYEVELPAMACGSKVDYYLSAAELGGEVFGSPAKAPDAFHTAWVAESLTTVFSDDFETNKGWTVSNDASLTSGGWERVVPVDSGAQPGYDSPDDGVSTRGYVTQNGAVGGSISANDVDGGPTRLTSPNLNFSAGDGLISYTRWSFSNGDLNDGLEVEVSNNAGASWVAVEDVTLKGGGWIRRCFRISDHVTPTSQVRVRFSASDNPNNSTTEAGVDDFLAQGFSCTNPAAMAVFRNGTGVNSSCYAANLPVLGTTWTGQVNAAGHPGATLTAVVFYSAGATGPILSGGEILVNMGSTKLFQSLVVASGGVDTHSFTIPNDPSLVGTFSASQGIILGGPSGWQACNAYDLTAGY